MSEYCLPESADLQGTLELMGHTYLTPLAEQRQCYDKLYYGHPKWLKPLPGQLLPRQGVYLNT